MQGGVALGLVLFAAWVNAVQSTLNVAPAPPAAALPIPEVPPGAETAEGAGASADTVAATAGAADTPDSAPSDSAASSVDPQASGAVEPAVASGVAGAEDPDEVPAPTAEPPPFVERYFPFLEDESEQGSISVGDTAYGWLVGARHISESDALGILPRQRGRDLGYGTDQITLLLEDAARRFMSRTGTRFWIGNIGRRGGGDIRYSVSHNSGRDADVALGYVDAKGLPADPPDLLQVDGAGFSRDKEHKLKFDAERTWQIVKALVESDRAQIEFLFLARNLTERVLRHAREKKEPTELIERAGTLLHQPGGAPHDDHLHVRVYCSERDVEGGCLNNGAVRPWARLYNSARARRIERSVAAMGSASEEQRARGIERLTLLQARDHLESVTARLDDASGRVRAAAALALAQWGGGEEASRLAAKLHVEEDPVARAAMLSALADLGSPSAGGFFAAALDRAGTLPWGRVAEAAQQPASPTPFLLVAEALSPLSLLAPQLGFMDSTADEPTFAMKLYIIDAAGFCDRPEPVAPLFTLLADADSTVRAHAALSLSRLLNRPLDSVLQDPAPQPGAVNKAIADLLRQSAPLHRADRSSWMAEGFTRGGFKVPELTPENSWEILRSFSAGEPYSYNAARALQRIAFGEAVAETGKKTKPPRPPVIEEAGAECRYWLKWLEARRGKLHLPPQPDDIGNNCK